MNANAIALLAVIVAIVFGLIQALDLGRPLTVVFEKNQSENLMQREKNSEKFRTEKENKQVENPSEENHIIEKENWAGNYISSTANINSPQSSGYTILISNGSRSIDFGLAGRIGKIYKEKGVKVIPSVLNSMFVSDGTFDAFFSGDVDREAANALSQYIDYLVLGRATMQYSNSGNYSNIEGMQSQITTEMKLSLRLFNTKTGQFINDVSLSSTGIGASKTLSTKLAADIILKELNQNSIVN